MTPIQRIWLKTTKKTNKKELENKGLFGKGVGLPIQKVKTEARESW